MKNATDNDPNLDPELYVAYTDGYRKNCFDCNIQERTENLIFISFSKVIMKSIFCTLKRPIAACWLVFTYSGEYKMVY